MKTIDQKINEHFQGLVVRKDLVKTVKGNAIVPSYVLEYLLGQYCATSDETSIQTGIETVKEILRKHYVHRNESGLIKSVIKEKGRHKVIDKISVALNDKTDAYEASFANLGIKKVLVDSDTIKKHPKLLVSGVWCIADLEYMFTDKQSASPWVMSSLKPIQLSHFDFDGYLNARKKFQTDEWIDLLVQSIGFNPEMLGRRSKFLQLLRLVPYCERNYNLIELGPKGTGKSHIYSEFSPHGILISGGEVTVPKLFVNNATGKIGLVGYWDTVAFDEFAGKNKRVNMALVDIMKNYMANKSFSRGIESIGAEASMVFVGNTQHTLPYMLKHTDLFDELPEKYYDSAFLDRLHFYVPGWEVDIIRGEMFSDGYGFVVDYLAEILRTFRNHDYSQRYSEYFELLSDISTRDRDGINKTFSGLMKVLFPHGEATEKEIEEVLRFAIEGRKRIKMQLMRIDPTYARVRFGYTKLEDGKTYIVRTLEEKEYPQYFEFSSEDDPASERTESDSAKYQQEDVPPEELKEQHLTFQENQRGVSFDKLLGPYLKGSGKITITDPYIRLFFQARNLMELLETIGAQKPDEDEIKVHLITIQDEFKGPQQIEYFEKMQESCAPIGIHFSWEFDENNSIHARHIVTDHGWKILLDRGLDIFQHYEMNDAFVISNRLQRYRACKAFEATFIKI
ncbi:MAG: ATP-dependent Lon protease [Desulfobacteraceae bacterium Eth-SRB2]|nr:MAG: ATP-dependent Lon protease [Desulfobacteraceae bacterium Eth-SRB2]